MECFRYARELGGESSETIDPARDPRLRGTRDPRNSGYTARTPFTLLGRKVVSVALRRASTEGYKGPFDAHVVEGEIPTTRAGISQG